MPWTRYTAPSDIDYEDQGRGHGPATTILHCPRCGTEIEVEADEQGPVLCESCRERDVRNDATGFSHEQAS